MTFVVRLTLSGQLRRDAFESSLEEAISYHPLLCCFVRRSPRKGLVWKLAPRLRPDDPLGLEHGRGGESFQPREST